MKFKIKCDKCGHEWESKELPRGMFDKNPTKCPKCGHIGGAVCPKG